MKLRLIIAIQLEAHSNNSSGDGSPLEFIFFQWGGGGGWRSLVEVLRAKFCKWPFSLV